VVRVAVFDKAAGYTNDLKLYIRTLNENFYNDL